VRGDGPVSKQLSVCKILVLLLLVCGLATAYQSKLFKAASAMTEFAKTACERAVGTVEHLTPLVQAVGSAVKEEMTAIAHDTVQIARESQMVNAIGAKLGNVGPIAQAVGSFVSSEFTAIAHDTAQLVRESTVIDTIGTQLKAVGPLLHAGVDRLGLPTWHRVDRPDDFEQEPSRDDGTDCLPQGCRVLHDHIGCNYHGIRDDHWVKLTQAEYARLLSGGCFGHRPQVTKAVAPSFVVCKDGCRCYPDDMVMKCVGQEDRFALSGDCIFCTREWDGMFERGIEEVVANMTVAAQAMPGGERL